MSEAETNDVVKLGCSRCQRKVRMSPFLQSRNVPFPAKQRGVRVNLCLPVKRRQALLRNSRQRQHLQAQFSGLGAQPFSLPLLNLILLPLENRLIVLLLERDHVVEDTG